MTKELNQAAPRNHGPIQETDLYDFAGWLTTRPGVMTVGRSCEVGPLSEAVAEYIKTFPERFALTQRPAAQAGEREAFIDWLETTWPKSHPKGSGNDYWRNGHVAALAWQARASLPTQPAAQADSMGMPTSCGKPLCSPDEHHPLCKLHKPAAQATPEPLPLGPLAKRNIYDAIRGAYDLGYNDARNARTVPGDSAPDYDGRSVEEDHGSALFNLLSKRLKPATPEPVGEPFAWTSMGQIRFIPPTQDHDTYTALYIRPAPGVPDFASLLKIKEPDGCAENIEQADRQEARCNGWNDCRDEVLNILAAAQAKGADHV